MAHIEHDLENFQDYAKVRKANTPLSVAPGKSYIIPEPYGVALVIGAWNYPIYVYN